MQFSYINLKKFFGNKSKSFEDFAATILDLSLKGYISFEMSYKNEIKIYNKYKEDVVELPEDEKIIYEILDDAMQGAGFTTISSLSKYAEKKYNTVINKLDKISKIVRNNQKKVGNVSIELEKISNEWFGKQTIYILCSIMLAVFMSIFPVVFVVCVLLAIRCRKNAIGISILTQKGFEEHKQWKSLKKYMEDYSLLKEKLAPDIILWEKYLVYATAFGISEKVVEQLKVVHPEMFEQNINNVNCAYWYIMNSPDIGTKGFSNFSNGLEKAYRSATNAYSAAHSSSSSGSGGGGGFSGGGGGRRRRW